MGTVIDPSIYITLASQPRPEMIASRENQIMFTKLVNQEELEEIIKEEALRQVPIYFYDPSTPTDDYWLISEGEELCDEEENVEDEEIAEEDPLDVISLSLLFDEGVANTEIRVIHFIRDRLGNWRGFISTRKLDNSDEADVERLVA